MKALDEALNTRLMNNPMESESTVQWSMAHFSHCPCCTIDMCSDDDEDSDATQEHELSIASQTATSFDHIGSLGQMSLEHGAAVEDVVRDVIPLQIRLCVCRFSRSLGTNAVSEALVTYVRECLRAANYLTEFLRQVENTHLSDYQDFLARVIATSTGDNVALTRRWMRKVAEATGVLPSTLFIEQLQIDDMYPVATGGFSDIYKGVANDKPVALKALRYTSQSRSFRKEFCMEALIWHQLDHPHILPLLGISQTVIKNRLCFVSPWMQHGHILQYLAIRPKLKPTKLLHQASLGLYYLHTLEPPLVHGDIKAVNLLINEKEEVFIADFGLISVSETYKCTFATAQDTRDPESAGTVRWMAPELLTDDDTKSRDGDIYAFGMTMLEVFTGRVPYWHLVNDGKVILAVSKGELPQRPDVTTARDLNDETWMFMNECWRAKGTRPDSKQLSQKLESLILCEQPGERDIGCQEEDDENDVAPESLMIPRRHVPRAASFLNSRPFKRPRLADRRFDRQLSTVVQQSATMRMSQKNHAEQQASGTSHPIAALQQVPHQQPEQLIRNQSTNPNLFQMDAMRTTHISVTGDANQLQQPLVNDSDLAGVQTHASIIPPHQQHIAEGQPPTNPQPLLTRYPTLDPAPSITNPGDGVPSATINAAPSPIPQEHGVVLFPLEIPNAEYIAQSKNQLNQKPRLKRQRTDEDRSIENKYRKTVNSAVEEITDALSAIPGLIPAGYTSKAEMLSAAAHVLRSVRTIGPNSVIDNPKL